MGRPRMTAVQILRAEAHVIKIVPHFDRELIRALAQNTQIHAHITSLLRQQVKNTLVTHVHTMGIFYVP